MMSSKQIDRLAVEAQARVAWGDSVEAIRDWLTSERVASWQIDDILREALEDRAASMRRRGIRGVLIGVLVLAIAVAVVFLPQELEKHGVPAMGRELGLFFAAALLVGMYGVKQLVDGAERIFRGAAAEGADSDVSDR